MKSSSFFGNIPHTESSYDAVWVCLSNIFQGLFIFRYSKCWNNDLITHL